MERVQRACFSVAANNFADWSAAEEDSSAAGMSLRELCHDLIEPAATIRWLVRAADAESGPDLRSRLGSIAVAAGQIAAICENILDRPRGHAGVRLDLLADDSARSVQVRYGGVIDVVSRPVMVLAEPGDIDRILYNTLTNACRAAGPAGRVRVLVDEADGQALLVIADSGHGLGGGMPGGREGLGLGIIAALTLQYGGSVHLGVSDLGGLAVTVRLTVAGGVSK